MYNTYMKISYLDKDSQWVDGIQHNTSVMTSPVKSEDVMDLFGLSEEEREYIRNLAKEAIDEAKKEGTWPIERKKYWWNK
jgi:hypothetical protein